MLPAPSITRRSGSVTRSSRWATRTDRIGRCPQHFISMSVTRIAFTGVRSRPALLRLNEPADQPYGDRSAGVTDPFGNVWYIATHKKDVPESQLQTLGSDVPKHQRPGSIMPFMYSEDPAGAFEFYRKVFGATEMHRVTGAGGKVSHVGMAIGETRVMLRDATTKDLAEYRKKGFASTPHKLGGTPLHLYIHVADADATYRRALDSGSKVVDPMEDKDWGDRCGGVQDPYGHIWYIATPLKNLSH